MLTSEIVGQFCLLTSAVGREVFGNQEAHDCFCGGTDNPQMSPEVLEFIKVAVREKMEHVARLRKLPDHVVTISFGVVSAVYKNPNCTINHPGSSCNISCGDE